LVSVIIPTFNNTHLLPLALQSIRAQTWADWECVVVDDGSDPPVEDVMGPIGDKRIRFVRHPFNRGRGAARVTGLHHASGDFIAWQDADDWSHPDRFTRQMAKLGSDPTLDFVATGLFVTDGHRCLAVTKTEETDVRRLQPLEDPPLAHPTCVFRRRVLGSFAYRTDLRIAEDYNFLCRALAVHPFAVISTPLYSYRYYGAMSLHKYWESQRVRMSTALATHNNHLARAWLRSAGFLGRVPIYAAARATGMSRRIAMRPYRTPEAEDLRAYGDGLAIVRATPLGEWIPSSGER